MWLGRHVQDSFGSRALPAPRQPDRSRQSVRRILQPRGKEWRSGQHVQVTTDLDGKEWLTWGRKKLLGIWRVVDLVQVHPQAGQAIGRKDLFRLGQSPGDMK